MSKPVDQMTLRMHWRGSTLDGYIFSDQEHARQWLMQPIIDRAKISLEPVEVGAFRPCPNCCGSGFHRAVKSVGNKVSAKDFLFGAINAE